MKKTNKILIAVSIFLVSLCLFIAYGTNVLRFYQNGSLANEPTLPIGSRMLVSSLIKPKKLDFVIYTYGDSLFGKGKRIHRLVGTPGDTIVIKKGVVFVNGNNIDAKLILAHGYSILSETAIKIREQLIPITYDGLPYYESTNDTVTVFMSQNIAAKNKLENFRLSQSINDYDHKIFSTYNQKWNIHHFGPLILKKKEYFVLGDNRDNSEDSRYIGVINKSQLIGKAVSF